MSTKEKVDKVIELKAAIEDADQRHTALMKIWDKLEETSKYSHHTDYARRLGITPDSLKRYLYKGIEEELTQMKRHIAQLYVTLDELFK